MEEQETKAWKQNLERLNLDVQSYNQYDAGLSYKQKEKHRGQRQKYISYIKHDILDFPPFAEIAYKICGSHFCFDECNDSMDGDMERTIREIQTKQIV